MNKNGTKIFKYLIIRGNRASAFISPDQPMFVLSSNSNGQIQIYSHRTEYPVLLHNSKDEQMANRLVKEVIEVFNDNFNNELDAKDVNLMFDLIKSEEDYLENI